MEKFNTGAVRSSRMPRYDLIPRVALERLAKRFTGELVYDTEGLGISKPTGGALKYGECNWEKGLPTSDVINHIFDHLTRWVNTFRENLKHYNGDMLLVRRSMLELTKNDDELAGAMWGLVVLMYQEDSGMFHDENFKVFTTDGGLASVPEYPPLEDSSQDIRDESLIDYKNLAAIELRKLNNELSKENAYLIKEVQELTAGCSGMLRRIEELKNENRTRSKSKSRR